MKAIAMVLVGACVLTGSASADILSFEANLDGLQMVPPNASPAFGSGTFSFDTATSALSVTVGNYQDLLGGANQVFLNVGAPGANGPFVFALTLDTPGAATGTFSGGGALTPAQTLSLNNGDLYMRITSAVFPGGEIRGQLLAVPAPGAAVLLGMAGLGVLRRRR